MGNTPRRVRCTTALLEEMRSACKILARNPETKRLLGRPGKICKNNIKMNHKVKDFVSISWITLSRDLVL
jgi:hypothetical protein